MRSFSWRRIIRWNTVSYLIIVGISVYAYLDDKVSWYLYIVLMLPVFVYFSMRQDHEASMAQPDLFDDPLVGNEVVAIEEFKSIDGGFEGRVLINGAPWTARSAERRLVEGDKSIVVSRAGSLLELEDVFTD